MSRVEFATCSWKYPSWEGIIYSRKEGINFLEEYSAHYHAVEVDQWFYAMPSKRDVDEYKKSVPKDFQFIIKVPNSLTLPFFPQRDKTKPLKKNPNFLSIDLYKQLLDVLKPIINQTPFLIFQFRYLNKQLMPDLATFENYFAEFMEKIPKASPAVAIETRNGNYLKPRYFKFLTDLGITHVFSEKIYMPPITEVYEQNKDMIKGASIIRLLGDDRGEIEKATGEDWSKIVFNKDKDLEKIVVMIKDLQKRKVDTYVNVNNHYEGSAPLTIKKIKKLL